MLHVFGSYYVGNIFEVGVLPMVNRTRIYGQYLWGRMIFLYDYLQLKQVFRNMDLKAAFQVALN